MPELPEVESIAAGLRREIVGRYVRRVRVWRLVVRGPVSLKEAGRTLAGARVIDVGRRGKRLILATDRRLALVIQLGMTGKFLLGEPEGAGARHVRMLIEFEEGQGLYFVDVRRFGRVWFVPQLNVADPDPAMRAAGLSALGPEPEAITAGQFRAMLAARRPIKSLLLDQARLAGLGNIYADEALFGAGIHPLTVAQRLNDGQAAALLRGIRQVLRRAIVHGGTTFSDFRNAYGEMGRFGACLQVYGRTGQPCRRCGASVRRVRIVGRSSHFCPVCQPRGGGGRRAGG